MAKKPLNDEPEPNIDEVTPAQHLGKLIADVNEAARVMRANGYRVRFGFEGGNIEETVDAPGTWRDETSGSATPGSSETEGDGGNNG